MALPGDLTTFDLQFGPYTDAAGVVVLVGAKGKLFPVDPSTNRRIRLTHVTSGQAILPKPVEITVGEDGTASLPGIPHTGQATLSPAGYAWRVEWSLQTGDKHPSPGNLTFVVPSGATADFDLLVPAATVPAVAISQPTVASVNGQTGAVSLDAADVGAATPGDLAAKADLVAGKLPESQVPARLSDVELRAAFEREGYDARGPLLQMLPANLLKWRKKLAQVRGGTSDAKILVIGDSTSWGTGATNPTAESWPAQLAQRMAGSVNTALGFIGAPSTISGNVNADPRWTVGAGWTLDSHGFGNAQCFKSSTSAGLLVLNLPEAVGVVDRYDVYYVANGGSPAFTVTATGGAATTVTPGAANGVVKTTASGTPTVGGTVTINPGTGTVRIVGIEAWSSSRPRVRMGNAGVPATSTIGWVNPNQYGPLPSISAYAPDLTIINLGLNDSGGGTTEAAFTANLTTLINRAKQTGDVLLMTFPPGFVDGTEGLRQSYLAAYRNLAKTLGCGLIDVNARLVSYAAANPLGYFADTLHLTTVGYSDVAQAALRAVADSADVQVDEGGPFGFVATFDPMLATASSTIGGTGRTAYYRVPTGGLISKVALEVVTSSGNMCLAVYRTVGTGRDAVPGVRLAATGTIPVPAVGYQEIALGSTVHVRPGDYLAIGADSSTAAFRGAYDSGIVNNLYKGRASYENVFPAPATPNPTVGLNRSVLLVGQP